MNRCIYCNKRLGTTDLNNVCSECANERKNTHFTTQPIILSRVDFSEKTPTADEVCKALSDFTKRQVTYNNAKKDFIDEYENSVEQFLFDAYHLKKIPPHIITLIGRFYEGLEVKE